MKKRIFLGIRIILIIYIILGVLFYIFQEKIIFQSRSLPADYKFNFDQPFREINLQVNDSKNISIIQFTVPDSICQGVVLYFHGTTRNITWYAHFAPNFTKNGYEVWMIDYPGYGKSTGTRTEKIIYDDALLLYKMAIKKCAADSIIIYGKSLGTAIAAELASIRDCKRLILEAPYYSLEALGRHYLFMYPVGLLSKYSFPTYSYFKFVNAPISLFSGTNDGLIPHQQAVQLSKLKPGVELISIKKGNHTNLSYFLFYHQKLDSLLNN